MDWSRIADAAILMAPSSIVSAYLGAKIKEFVDRAIPLVTISSCRISSGRDLLSSNVLISQELSLKLRDSSWAPTMLGNVSAYRLAGVVDKLKESTSNARLVLDFLKCKIQYIRRPESLTVEEKRNFLDEISRNEVSIIDSVIVGGLVRREIELSSLPQDSELLNITPVAEYSESDKSGGGYHLDLRTKRYLISYKDKSFNKFLLPYAKALSVFHVPSIIALLEFAEASIVRWAAAGDSLISELEGILESGTHLRLEVTVINRGRFPVTFSPLGKLKIFGTKFDNVEEINLVRTIPSWKPEDPLAAFQQEAILREIDETFPEESVGFTVPGAGILKVVYRSKDSISSLQSTVQHFKEILSMEVYLCQVRLQRADISSVSKSWINSAVAHFGVNGELHADITPARVTGRADGELRRS